MDQQFVERATPARAERSGARMRRLVDQNLGYIWRVLRRFGVATADLPDASQQVFIVAARRVDDIREGSERAFLYQTALRVASDARRSALRQAGRHDPLAPDHPDESPDPEELLNRARARARLDRVLAEMPMDLRAVFVLFELEEMTMIEIAEVIDAPPGTVASRLRRARELFHAAAAKIRAQGGEP